MKIKMIFASMLAVFALASCSNDSEPSTKTNEGPENVVAYVSLKVHTPEGKSTRASKEEEPATPAESVVNTLYAVVFDASNKVVALTGQQTAQEALGTDKLLPGAFKVPSTAKSILLVANPGTKLLGQIQTTAGTHFDVLNKAIVAANDIDAEIITAKGFTMINSGTAVEKTSTATAASLCLVDIKNNIKIFDGTKTEDAVKAEAEADRVNINIERLTSKVIVKENSSINVKKGKFTFGGWVLDATNATFFPWAKKVKTGTAVNAGVNYKDNFYTIDPNFFAPGNANIRYNKVVNGVPSKPGTTTALDWLAKDANTYCAENTMDAPEQRFMNATRVVIKATYYPDANWTGDWFSFAGIAYENLAALQADYADANKVNFRAACDKFFAKVKGDKPGIAATNFSELTPAELSSVSYGGEVTKEDESIRWYQGGLNYYWYEIRHDDGITANMAFAKYGVVRNNWYELTVNSVSGPGTPWYPIIDPTDPNKDKDPEPTDPIDEVPAYIGVSVKVMPWIKWSHGIDL